MVEMKGHDTFEEFTTVTMDVLKKHPLAEYIAEQQKHKNAVQKHHDKFGIKCDWIMEVRRLTNFQVRDVLPTGEGTILRTLAHITFFVAEKVSSR